MILAMILAAALASGAAAAPAQPHHPAAHAAAFRPPRLPDGHPDLNGVWRAMNAADYDLEAHSARAAMQLRAGPAGPVPAREVVALGAVGAVPGGLSMIVDGDGTIPYKPEALAAKKDNQAHWAERDPEVKCYLPGVPRAAYVPHPFQVFQSDKALLFAYAYAGAVRNILFKDPGPAPVDSWMGQSVGHWEGDTLVVDVTGMNDSTWLSRAGDPHSSSLHVVERYTLTAPGVMRYEARIEDPETYTRPWTMRMNLYRLVGDDAQMMQFKCVEFVEELIYGKLRKDPLP
jgi:hypothetical protein